MSDDPQKIATARPPKSLDGGEDDVHDASTRVSKAPADLLELVRSAEEGARVVADRKVAKLDGDDIHEEVTRVAPSIPDDGPAKLPSKRPPQPITEAPVSGARRTARVSAPPVPIAKPDTTLTAEKGLPPIAAIALFFAAVVVALFALVR